MLWCGRSYLAYHLTQLLSAREDPGIQLYLRRAGIQFRDKLIAVVLAESEGVSIRYAQRPNQTDDMHVHVPSTRRPIKGKEVLGMCNDRDEIVPLHAKSREDPQTGPA